MRFLLYNSMSDMWVCGVILLGCAGYMGEREGGEGGGLRGCGSTLTVQGVRHYGMVAWGA